MSSSQHSDLLVAFIDAQPVTVEVVQTMQEVCDAVQELLNEIMNMIVQYGDTQWYHFTGASLRKRIQDKNHEAFRLLAFLAFKVQHLYRDCPITLMVPRWTGAVQEAATKSRQFAAWLQSKGKKVTAEQLENMYDNMFNVYELQRLNLRAVVSTMEGLSAALERGDTNVWKEDFGERTQGPVVLVWLPDLLCEVEPLEDLP